MMTYCSLFTDSFAAATTRRLFEALLHEALNPYAQGLGAAE